MQINYLILFLKVYCVYKNNIKDIWKVDLYINGKKLQLRFKL